MADGSFCGGKVSKMESFGPGKASLRDFGLPDSTLCIYCGRPVDGTSGYLLPCYSTAIGKAELIGCIAYHMTCFWSESCGNWYKQIVTR